jgi:uncharacterized membrane protein YebE (DUF533 family)
MRLHGNLANVEEEWRIAALPEWIDPVFVFQRSWFPDDVTRPGSSFDANLAKAVSILGGGLAAVLVWRRTENKAYAALAGAGSALAAPLLVSAYDNFQKPRVRLNPDLNPDLNPGDPLVNTYLVPDAQLVIPRNIDQRIVNLVTGSPAARSDGLNPQTMNLLL